MWLLSCTGDLFGGRRIWLRPGSSHLLGRSSAGGQNGERMQYIEHKSVSRKHLYLQVSHVTPGSCTNLLTKSTITAIDGSKTGTFIDNQRIEGENKTRQLDGHRYEIKLGHADVIFILEWFPVVLSFTSGIPKAAKAKGTALAQEREKLEGLDIKVCTEYVSNTTTHAIAKKRNTASVLQALVQGRWVVASSYVDALVAACQSPGLDETGWPRPSALEKDFDTNWPKEEGHICPTGGEPIERPNDWLKPNPAREEVFKDYLFLFLTSSQYENLSPMINSGGGKAFFFDFRLGESTVEEVIDKIKDLAGMKDSHTSMLTQSGPGAVVLIRPSEADAVRKAGLVEDIDLTVGQRSCEQSEFLDAVLSVDASVMRKPLRNGPDYDEVAQASIRPTASSSIPPPPLFSTRETTALPDSPPAELQHSQPQENVAPMQDQTAQQSVQQETSRKRRRFLPQKQFKGFDDFDESQILRTNEKSPEPLAQPSQVPRSQGTAVEEVSPHSPNTELLGRKRPAPDDDPEEETPEQRDARMFPGLATMKRRRTEAAARGDKSASKAPAVKAKEKEKHEGEELKAKVKKDKEAEKDIKARIAAQRKAEEEKRRKDDEAEEEIRNMDPDDVPEIKHQPVIFELPVRPPRPNLTSSENPDWDGRPNYKKFRRKGSDRRRAPGETQRLMVPLEEVSTRGYGLGDEYWLEHGDIHAKHRRTEVNGSALTPSRSQNTRGNSVVSSSIPIDAGNTRDEIDEDERVAFRRRVERSRQEDMEEHEAGAMWVGKQSANGTILQSTNSTLGADLQKRAAGKRPAANQLGGPTTKKVRQTALRGITPAAIEISDDDDDPRTFRRKRR